jgi:2-(1,2-epoxy-1,2-dihydrophenyl)acetyl-CoA isomerase
MDELRTSKATNWRDEREREAHLPTHERILGVALRLFAEKGFEAVGIRSIASETGVTTAALYHYAATKEELLMELMERGIRKLLGSARETIPTLRTPEQKLAALVQLHVVSHGTHKLLHTVNDTEFRTLSGANYELIRGKRDEYEALWREVVTEGASRGVFSVDDPKLATFALLQMCTGVTRWYSPDGPLSIVDIATRFVDMALSLVGAERDGKRLRAADLELPGPARFLTAEIPEAREEERLVDAGEGRRQAIQLKGKATVDYEVEDGIARIYLNRPPRLNAVVPQLVEDICLVLDQAVSDEVGAVILAGRGRAFCVGHDLRHEEPPITEAEERRRLQRIQDVTRKIRGAPCPVICAVHGYALGAGCEFALASDLIVAARDAQFGFPEVGVGRSITGGISRTLPITVGLARAKELVLLGQHFSAERAEQLGIINRIVEADALEDAALELAQTLRDSPRLALKLAKRALDRDAQSDIEATYELEVAHALIARRSEDAVRATEAFRRKAASRAKEER